ncbi:hypothetical protein MGN70_002575 [Eutypa lata]|nr:hypothetical protein MGN70_002575 [Eutypa lata]
MTIYLAGSYFCGYFPYTTAQETTTSKNRTAISSGTFDSISNATSAGISSAVTNGTAVTNNANTSVLLAEPSQSSGSNRRVAVLNSAVGNLPIQINATATTLDSSILDDIKEPAWSVVGASTPSSPADRHPLAAYAVAHAAVARSRSCPATANDDKYVKIKIEKPEGAETIFQRMELAVAADGTILPIRDQHNLLKHGSLMSPLLHPPGAQDKETTSFETRASSEVLEAIMASRAASHPAAHEDQVPSPCSYTGVNGNSQQISWKWKSA